MRQFLKGAVFGAATGALTVLVWIVVVDSAIKGW